MPARKEVLEINGREVTITNPDKVYFPDPGYTKMDLVSYYLAVADGALRGAGGRPMALKRFVDGITKEAFFQKRAPDNRPEWLRIATLTFPSGRTADEIVIDDAAGLAWVANLGCIDLNPHPVRADDLDHPDELRIDLDPVPGVPWSQIRDVAMTCRDSLADVGLVGWPKTSGSRGIHINARIEPRSVGSGGASGRRQCGDLTVRRGSGSGSGRSRRSGTRPPMGSGPARAPGSGPVRGAAAESGPWTGWAGNSSFATALAGSRSFTVFFARSMSQSSTSWPRATNVRAAARPLTPAPTIAAVPGRPSVSAASTAAAPVRRAVTAPASSIATSLPSDASDRSTSPVTVGRPRAGLPG